MSVTRIAASASFDPHPNPPPFRGREHTESAAFPELRQCARGGLFPPPERGRIKVGVITVRDGAVRRMMEDRTIPLDAETKVTERPHDHKDELRLWLRLFTCKEVIETEVRRRLRDNFDV